MLKLKLRNYSDAYVLVKATITVARQGADASGIETDKNSWQVIFENCNNKISNTRVDNVKNFDILMPRYNLMETMIVMENHREIYGNIVEMKQMMIVQIILVM